MVRSIALIRVFHNCLYTCCVIAIKNIKNYSTRSTRNTEYSSRMYIVEIYCLPRITICINYKFTIYVFH